MSQPSVASFFNTRKRAAADEINLTRNKVFLIESSDQQKHVDCDYLSPKSVCPKYVNVEQCQFAPSSKAFEQQQNNDQQTLNKKLGLTTTTRSGRTVKRIGVTSETDESATKSIKLQEQQTKAQQKLVTFIKKGNLSPRKKPKSQQQQVFAPKETNIEKNNEATPNKQKNAPDDNLEKQQKLKNLVRKELNFDEVKTKVSRSAKLQELKSSLSRIQELEKTRKAQEDKNKRMKNGDFQQIEKKPNGISLKEFKTIELEVLTSPRKGLSTPTKLVPPAPDKNGLMSPKRTATPKRILFSPSKDGSPAKIVVPPAYQRFLNLTESAKTTALQLPYKYRFLVEVFKCLDSVVALYFNRKEIITFKKLKPAVQRMLRKNFHESHLAQIKHLYPDAFTYHQMKMRNYGSISKQDYFQLVIAPNIDGNSNYSKMAKIDEDNVLKSAQLNAMNPQIMIERHQKLQNILLEKCKNEHAKFLATLDPPLEIEKDKLRRWHPEFDLENLPEIEMAHIPQPPNIEKYSSAKDILSTARNLFNCSTPMERVMERFEAKSESEKNELLMNNNLKSSSSNKPKDGLSDSATPSPVATLLKGVPQSLLEKIRAKQAAKALDAMTRRPSQDREAAKYSRLPELARHLRNVFITEKKAVLPLENVIKKIENSYRTNLTNKDIETHLQMINKQCPNWIAFHDIRKTVYLKMARDADLGKIIEKLEKTANEKLK